MLLVPVVAVFSMVKFSVNVGLVLFTFDANVAVKSEPFKVIAGVVRAVLTVMFGAVIFPANDCAVVADKLALSRNVVANEVPFNVIAGVVKVPPALTVMFGAVIVPA